MEFRKHNFPKKKKKLESINLVYDWCKQKLSYSGGSYMNGHFSQVYPAGQAIVGANTVMPMYPFYQYHQSQTMGLPAATHIFPPTTAGPIPTIPAAIMSKPVAAIAPNSGNTPLILHDGDSHGNMHAHLLPSSFFSKLSACRMK